MSYCIYIYLNYVFPRIRIVQSPVHELIEHLFPIICDQDKIAHVRGWNFI